MARDLERWMVVGLGNPGPRYRDNRHNVGFMVVDLLCADEDTLQLRGSQRFDAELAVGELARHPTVVLKPQTYMNLSGRSVGPVAHFYRIPPERVIVVHDDVDLGLARLKLKRGGGDGGHNGLRSVTECLGSPDYVRVRFGVDRPARGEVADYVLSGFSAAEQAAVDEGVGRAARAVRTVITRGLKEAMNRFNRAPKTAAAAPAAAKDETEKRDADG